MNYVIIGTCSLCGGDVQRFDGPWAGVGPPPPPACVRCGAERKRPVIPMHNPPRREVDGRWLELIDAIRGKTRA